MTIEQFHDSYIPEPNTGCFLWTKGRDAGGYGVLVLSPNNKKVLKAHRIAYEVEHGPVSNEIDVLHHCDVPRCVNPRHLFLGTQTDNNRDMWNKGRGYHIPPRKGESHGGAILTNENVREIRRLSAEGMPGLQIARRFSVDKGTIYLILNGKHWKHVE